MRTILNRILDGLLVLGCFALIAMVSPVFYVAS